MEVSLRRGREVDTVPDEVEGADVSGYRSEGRDLSAPPLTWVFRIRSSDRHLAHPTSVQSTVAEMVNMVAP